MRRLLSSLLCGLLCGLLFGVGLALSQMTDPLKVLGFLDIMGDWDPSLAFVMGGAVGVTLLAFRFILKRPRPVLDAQFHLPPFVKVDAPLMIGAALFGAGWGMSGYCPGPAIATLFSHNAEAWWFVPAMLLGTILQRWHAAKPASTAAN